MHPSKNDQYNNTTHSDSSLDKIEHSLSRIHILHIIDALSPPQ